MYRAGGLWFWIPALALAVSSVAFNLSDEVFKPALRWFGPVTPDAIETLPERPAGPPPRLAYEPAMAAAQRLLPPAQAADAVLSYISYLPEKRAYWAAFEPPDKANRLLALACADVFVDADSGQALGLPGRILVCAGGLVTALLSVTGVIIWWKKRRGRSRRPGPPALTS